jgi:hypothetical protein
MAVDADSRLNVSHARRKNTELASGLLWLRLKVKPNIKGKEKVSKGVRPMRYFGRKGEEGKIGYIILWLLGVPAGLLFLIFLLRGCT